MTRDLYGQFGTYIKQVTSTTFFCATTASLHSSASESKKEKTQHVTDESKANSRGEEAVLVERGSGPNG